jgi:hypothetical protein
MISKAVKASGLSGWKVRASARSPFKRQARARVNPQNGQGLPVSQRKPQKGFWGSGEIGKNARSIKMLPKIPIRQTCEAGFSRSAFGRTTVDALTGSKVLLVLKPYEVTIGSGNRTVGEREGQEDADKTGQGAHKVD